MTVAIDITKEQRKALLALLHRYIPGVAVWAYGSRVKWTARPNSDLDLVAFTTPEQRPLVAELKDELAESSAIPFLVDLHIWDEIPERFREIIREEYVILQRTEEAREGITGEWNQFRISDLITNGKLVIGDGYRAKNDELSQEGLPFARAGNINDGFHFSGADCFPEQHLHRVGNKISQPGDVVFTSKGSVGRFAFVRADTPRFVYSPQLCFWRSIDPEVLDPRFLYFWMSGREFFVQFKGVAGQTDMAEYVSLTDQRRMFITLPTDINTQRAIVAVLGALDDKIESNRRTSRVLERLARAIFRAWFVDFEPVKAKVAGARSFPGMSQEVFDSLPTRLVESELGPVPEGWEVGCIGDVVSVRGGGTPSTTVGEYWENGTHCWLTPKDLSGMKDHILLTTARKITDKGVAKISSGLLPVGSVLLSSRAPVGYLVLSGVPTAINQGFIAMVCDGPLPPHYVFLWTQSVMDEIKNRASGTTFPEISKTAFRPIKVCVPTKPVLESFTAVVEPLFEKLAANIRESQSLERLRDYLLPKLLSGEVRVAE